MNIGIDVNVAKDEQPRGVGFHIVNLLREIGNLDRHNQYYLYYQRGLFSRSRLPGHFPLAENFHFRPISFPDKWIGEHPRLWWDVWLPRRLRRDRLDVFHGPGHFLPALARTRSVVTIHDLAYFKMDHLYPEGQTLAMRAWTRKSLGRAKRVIALSQNTASDVEQLGVDRDRLKVIYGGANVVLEDEIQKERIDEIRRRYRLPSNYILYVGTLHPRKNVPFLLQAYAQLRRDAGCTLGIVIVGRRDSAADEILRMSDELGIGSDVVITGYVDDWEIPLFYKMADVFVLPTLYEGFTLVTLEAMHYGVPVISTDTSSIREGVGDAAILVPVNDVPALTGALRQVLQDDRKRAEMVRLGREQAAKFTWRECARQTIDLYEEVGGNCDRKC